MNPANKIVDASSIGAITRNSNNVNKTPLWSKKNDSSTPLSEDLKD